MEMTDPRQEPARGRRPPGGSGPDGAARPATTVGTPGPGGTARVHAARREPDPAARAGMATLAVVQVILGGWMTAAPGSFTERLAPFGARNDHLLRDMASWELALAGAAAIAVVRPAWRVPVVALALVHVALHALNHLVDVGGADPAWVGPADLASLVVGVAALAWLLVRVRRTAA